MIFDEIKNAHLYFSLNERLKEGFEFLINSDLKNLPDGKHIIKGDKIYANVQSMLSKPFEEQKWEAHRKYIDIQYVIKGREKMGYGLLSDFDKTIIPYDDNKDVTFLEGKNYNYINVKEDSFVIFFPNDVHAPMLCVEEPEEIKKVIVKVKI